MESYHSILRSARARHAPRNTPLLQRVRELSSPSSRAFFTPLFHTLNQAIPISDFIRPTYLYPKQHDAVFCPHRWGIIESGTKTGATVACIAWLLEKAFGGKPGESYWWVSPTNNQAEIVYRKIKSGLPRGAFVANDTPTPRILLPHGVTIAFKSADKPSSLDDEEVYAAVMDTPAACKESSWFALRGTLTSTEAPARLAGKYTKGRDNWFYSLARRAEENTDINTHYAKLTILDAIEAGIISQAEVDDAKRNLPELVFRELYMAEPCDAKFEGDSWRGNPKTLPDEELALIAGIDPKTLVSITNETLKALTFVKQ